MLLDDPPFLRNRHFQASGSLIPGNRFLGTMSTFEGPGTRDKGPRGRRGGAHYLDRTLVAMHRLNPSRAVRKRVNLVRRG